MAHVLVVTLNPALDLSIQLPRLEPGAVNRTRSSHLAAAGKGLNVAQVLASLGHRVTLSGFLGADNDTAFVQACRRDGIEDASLRLPGETRINAKLAEDDGRVTDSQGRLVSFKNTILIMTSNIGSQFVLDGLLNAGEETEQQAKKSTGERKTKVMDAVRGHFRPEFINRVDEWIVFDPLLSSQVEAIVLQQIGRVRSRLKDRRIAIEIEESALEALCVIGYQPAFGARPIKRAVQQYLETSIAKAILRGDISEEDVAVVSAKRVEDDDLIEGGQQYEFEVKRKARAKKQAKSTDSVDEEVTK